MKRYFEKRLTAEGPMFLAYVALAHGEPWAQAVAIKLDAAEAMVQFCCENHARRWMWAQCIEVLRQRRSRAAAEAHHAIQQARLRALRHEALASLPKWNPAWTNLTPQQWQNRMMSEAIRNTPRRPAL